jgi:periplasmic protein TonB
MITPATMLMMLMLGAPAPMPDLPVACSLTADPVAADEQQQKKAGTELEELDEPPSVVTSVSPAYPESAMKDSLEGVIYLGVLIGKDGKVKDVEVKKGVREDLNAAAIAAIRQWVFKPPMKKKAAVEAMVVVPVKFKLAPKSK